MRREDFTNHLTLHRKEINFFCYEWISIEEASKMNQEHSKFFVSGHLEKTFDLVIIEDENICWQENSNAIRKVIYLKDSAKNGNQTVFRVILLGIYAQEFDILNASDKEFITITNPKIYTRKKIPFEEEDDNDFEVIVGYKNFESKICISQVILQGDSRIDHQNVVSASEKTVIMDDITTSIDFQMTDDFDIPEADLHLEISDEDSEFDSIDSQFDSIYDDNSSEDQDENHHNIGVDISSQLIISNKEISGDNDSFQASCQKICRFSCVVSKTCEEKFETDKEVENHVIEYHTDSSINREDVNELLLAQYKSESDRLMTFKRGWPNLDIFPEKLVDAGFIYTGREDHVQCVYCAGVIGSWVINDDPMTEHKKSFPNCPFIRGFDEDAVPIMDDLDLCSINSNDIQTLEDFVVCENISHLCSYKTIEPSQENTLIKPFDLLINQFHCYGCNDYTSGSYTEFQSHFEICQPKVMKNNNLSDASSNIPKTQSKIFGTPTEITNLPDLILFKKIISKSISPAKYSICPFCHEDVILPELQRHLQICQPQQPERNNQISSDTGKTPMTNKNSVNYLKSTTKITKPKKKKKISKISSAKSTMGLSSNENIMTKSLEKNASKCHPDSWNQMIVQSKLNSSQKFRKENVSPQNHKNVSGLKQFQLLVYEFHCHKCVAFSTKKYHVFQKHIKRCQKINNTMLYQFPCVVSKDCKEKFQTDKELENHVLKHHSNNNFKKEDVNELLLAQFKSETDRLKTFQNRWPNLNIHPEILADAGFIYTGREDYVQCVFCAGIIGHWESNDDPMIEHEKSFPLCAFVNKWDVGNIPMIFPFRCVVNKTCIETFETDKDVENHVMEYHSNCDISREDVNELLLAKFKSESDRLLTFKKGWPNLGVFPEKLAKAGFIYTGREDYVQCVFCAGIIGHWESNDDPMTEHKKSFSKCAYVCGCDVGNINQESRNKVLQYKCISSNTKVPCRVCKQAISPRSLQMHMRYNHGRFLKKKLRKPITAVRKLEDIVSVLTESKMSVRSLFLD